MGIVLASFIEGEHLQAAVVTYPNIQIYRKYFCRLIIVDVTAGSNRGYYTVARRYEFYVPVARTISHE